VETATWLAFWRCPGDHRFAIIDFKSDVLVGDNVLKVAQPEARRLSSSIPTAVANYNQTLSNFFITHKMLQSLHRLYAERHGNFTPEQAQQLQGLDILRSQGMRHAEKKCRKLSMGNVDYSPIVSTTRLR
jgi:hypothetical protein